MSSFVYTTYIATSPSKVWEALTNAQYTKEYFFGRRVYSDWKVGSEVKYLRENDELEVYGEIIKCKPQNMVTFTWKDPDYNKVDKFSQVTFEILPLNETVRLTIKHENLSTEEISDDENSFAGINNGWPAIISNLKTLLETGKTLAAIRV